MEPRPGDRPLSRWWRRSTLIVMATGFSVLAGMTLMTYRKAPPIPERVVTANGDVLFTGDDILHGQEVFLKYALMEHGTLWGHGAYLGPDYSAAYLHREAEIVGADAPRILKQNRYDFATKTLTYSAGEAESFSVQRSEWADYFNRGAPGQPALFIRDPAELKALAAYFAWAAWATRANRPGRAYSYTSNWPYEPLAGNTPTPEAILWSAVSLVFLLGGLGIVLFAFGKFGFLGWRGEDRSPQHIAPFGPTSLTPSQRTTAWYFLVVAVLFLLQALAGGALAHYRVEPQGFYGVDLAKWFPYNLLRTYHLQLAVFWIATAWVAGGLFLAPLVGGAEPRGQNIGVLALLVALAIVVFGSLGGEMLGVRNLLGKLWFWLGHQGSEYLDLGRFWQVLLAVGLIFWLFLMARALRPALAQPKIRELTALFLIAAVGIVIFYVPAFFYGRHTNFAVIDNWRFWIIHLWVEGFFELFATVVVALMFTVMGLTTVRTATRVVYLDAILYLAGGIIGTSHHWYFTGQESLTMALGGCFSALEVVPLTLLTLDAWDFINLQRKTDPGYQASMAASQKWSIRFLVAVGVWNFVGAGVFGFLINLPIVSYFEMGTTLTPNHGHAAMFGVFGMLALAVLTFCLRALTPDLAWTRAERFFRAGFWGLNIGLGLMIVLNLFPAGVLQLYDVIQNGYAHARSLDFTMTGWFHRSEWIRIIGDMVFLFFGAVPVAIGATLAVMNLRKEKI
jgi:nitric oxide reductase subunit B